MLTKHFKAPWGTALRVMSVLATMLCLGITIARWPSLTLSQMQHLSFWLDLIPAALVLGCALFTIRGYTLTGEALLIQRLFWQTRIPLAELQSAAVQPQAMRSSIRTFGNGGFFSFSGFYRNAELGSYRAFVTDFERTVILRFPNRTIAVSPDHPEDFVRALFPQSCNTPPQ